MIKLCFSKTVIYHFNNDFSGSPVALRNRLIREKINDYVIVTFNRGGVLDDLNLFVLMPNALSKTIPTSVKLLIFWFVTAFISLFFQNKYQEFNTILTVPSLFLLSRIRPNNQRHKVFLHEFNVNNNLLNIFLMNILKKTRSNFVFVSILQKRHFFEKHGIYGEVKTNYIDPLFCELSKSYIKIKFDGRFRVTFVGSAKKYKGMKTFIRIAETYTKKDKIKFTIVTPDELSKLEELNIQVYQQPSKEKLAKLYSESLFVLNLSDERLWVETFGMTIFEACSLGALTITPNTGGFIDYLDATWSFRIDTSLDVDQQVKLVTEILNSNCNSDLWNEVQKNMLDDFNNSKTLIKIIGA